MRCDKCDTVLMGKWEGVGITLDAYTTTFLEHTPERCRDLLLDKIDKLREELIDARDEMIEHMELDLVADIDFNNGANFAFKESVSIISAIIDSMKGQ